MIEKEISDFKMKIDEEIGRFLDFELSQNKERGVPEELSEAVELIRIYIIRGGKRLRPFLFYKTYELSGRAEDLEEALKVSMALEFLHAYFLIHDDIIDCDGLRHNGLAMHKQYEEQYAGKVVEKDLEHFGVSMAILAGDLLSSWVYRVISTSNLDSEKKLKAIQKISEITSDTLAGEMIDQTLGIGSSFEEDLIFKVFDYKTARYTVAAPFELGAILAGASHEEIEYILRFAIPLGIAFQIKDDIIGLLGDGNKIGKPVGSDIKEGKKTLLMSFAVENASAGDKEYLLSRLGKKDLSQGEIEEVRGIIRKCGALEYAENKIAQFADAFRGNLEDKSEFFGKYAFVKGLESLLLKREV